MPHKLTADQRMKYARAAADSARCLDTIQSPTSIFKDMSAALLEAPMHVEPLQELAALLAGDRVNEIFVPDQPKEEASHEPV